MPLALLSHRTYYRLEGPSDRPVLVLSHSLGQDHGMWDAQIADLTAHFRVLRYDTRGHGGSEATPGDYTIEQLGRDVVALVDHLTIDRFAFCGLSMGGMIGMWLAAHVPERVTHIVLANTSARPEAERMEARRQVVLASGMASVVEAVMGRFFSARALAQPSSLVATARHTLLSTNPVGYAGCCAALRDTDLRSQLTSIGTPTLIIDGTEDISLPWAGHGDVIAAGIAHASVVRLPTAHLSNIERPRAFAAAIHAFLLPAREDARDAGLEIRRAVLGSEHVDRALATSSSPAFQDLITRYAWGSVWSRPGLDRRTRRLLTLALAASLGRWEEFRLHVRAGFAHDLEWCDLEEVLLHTAVYAGVPAANTALHVAAELRDHTGTARSDGESRS